MREDRPLPQAQRRILESLADGALHSYAEIARATGQHSGLEAELRERSPRGLGAKGLCREFIFRTKEHLGIVKPFKSFVCAFQINPVGCLVLGIETPALLADPDAAKADFAERYKQWLAEYRRYERLGKSIGLRCNPYRLLFALGTDPDKEFTFSDLARITGITSALPQDIRARHGKHRSNLGHLGLCRETVIEEDDGGCTFAFKITAKGLELLAKAHDPGDSPPPSPKEGKGRRKLRPPLPCGDDID